MKNKNTKSATIKNKDTQSAAIENIVINIIVAFCENAAELGCPMDKEVDMWFRYLSQKEQRKVAKNLLRIEFELLRAKKIRTRKDNKI